MTSVSGPFVIGETTHNSFRAKKFSNRRNRFPAKSYRSSRLLRPLKTAPINRELNGLISLKQETKFWWFKLKNRNDV